MRLAGIKIIGLTVFLALASSMAGADVTNKSARASEKSTLVRGVIPSHAKNTRKSASKKHRQKRGQQAMKPSRVREIQAALIRNKYLKGRANGIWDERSRNAMARFQSENGWQSKVVPDSRALIKLGLGPSYAGLLNPETAVITR